MQPIMRAGVFGSALGVLAGWLITIQWAWLAHRGLLYASNQWGDRHLPASAVLLMLGLAGTVAGLICGGCVGCIATRLPRHRLAVLAGIALAMAGGMGFLLFRAVPYLAASLPELAVRTALPIVAGVVWLERATRPPTRVVASALCVQALRSRARPR
jgi:hypothetical protein